MNIEDIASQSSAVSVYSGIQRCGACSTNCYTLLT